MKATAPGLAERLPAIVPSHSVIGSVASYFVDTFGFSAECRVVAWSGDNPCSLAGLGIGQPGDVGVSLGTSDTVRGGVRGAYQLASDVHSCAACT